MTFFLVKTLKDATSKTDRRNNRVIQKLKQKSGIKREKSILLLEDFYLSLHFNRLTCLRLKIPI